MAEWRKSSYTDNEQGACVEVAKLEARVGVRDSKDPAGPKLAFPAESFAGLLREVKAGKLDL
ncbi:DUF397 domain-containing protein [Actinomadura vinacea]|uniref:DUF397 domain-containing protein n=1 Tax=Actinomadura vinacea TaxID=115336 RepID=A0ABN3JDG6_9ACTN